MLQFANATRGNAPPGRRVVNAVAGQNRCVATKVPAMFTYRSLLGTAAADLENCAGPESACKGSAVKKAIYVVGLVLLGGALILQSVWG